MSPSLLFTFDMVKALVNALFPHHLVHVFEVHEKLPNSSNV